MIKRKLSFDEGST